MDKDMYYIEKLALEKSDFSFESSTETRYFDYETPLGGEWQIEVVADVICKHGVFEIEIQYVKIKAENSVFYVGDGRYPHFEKEIENLAINQDWSF